MKLHANAALSLNQRRPRRSPIALMSVASKRSRRCAGCGSPGRRSPSCWGWRSRRSQGSVSGSGWASSGAGALSPPSATSARVRASCCTSTSRSWGASRAAPGTAGPAATTTTAPAPIPEGRRRQTVGWEFVHVAVDDCSRLAYAEVLPNENAATAIAFLRRAVAFYRRHGIIVEALLTDNGAPYRSTMHAIACRTLHIRHQRTRPRRPQTNGKAERFIRTMLAGWASGALYRDSPERTAALDGWLWHYNHQRRHSALRHKPPTARLNERTNLLETYT